MGSPTTDYARIKLTHIESGWVCYDIQVEDGNVTDDPNKAQPRRTAVANIRAALLEARVGAEFKVEVEPCPVPPVHFLRRLSCGCEEWSDGSRRLWGPVHSHEERKVLLEATPLEATPLDGGEE